MESTDKGVTVPKWVLIPQIRQIIRPHLSAQAQKFGIFEKKTLSGCPYSLVVGSSS